MEWCLECHRNPENFVRPADRITAMNQDPAKGGWPQQNSEFIDSDYDMAGHKVEPKGEHEATGHNDTKLKTTLAVGRELVKKNKVQGPNIITSCSTCHR